MIAIRVANEQAGLPVDEDRLRRAVAMVLEGEGASEAEISVAVVDDRTIRRLNHRHLGHDDATDVLSFVLEQSEQRLEGEIVASAETAEQAAPQFGWSAADELLLYVIHGVLHLVGYDDRTPQDQARMRAREKAYLTRFGLSPQYNERIGVREDLT